MAKISIKWDVPSATLNLDKYISKYRLYLHRCGLKDNTIELYCILVNNYLRQVNTSDPAAEDANSFYNSLHTKKLSRSSLNNYSAAIIKYQDMIEIPVKLPFLKLNNALPYVFDEKDVTKIFKACTNFKHRCMLKVLFFGCLRSGELCNLDVQDFSPEDHTLRLRETKNNSDAIVFINEETATDLSLYLSKRPPLSINGRDPLFYTDFQNRWTNREVYKMFLGVKQKAGITKKGSVHCFSRHSPATLMIRRGCDLRSVQSILRHRDIHTTLRYTHLCDAVKREKHSQYLTL